MPPRGHIWMGSSGCLLPLLIIFNLFFGKLIFNSVGLWLGVEAVLILMFTLQIKLMVSQISRQFELRGRGLASASQSHRPDSKIIDVQGQEVRDEKEQG